jgi:predicted phosphoribosyltransferase
LEVLVVRKIGHPHYREFAVGALAEGGVVVLDRDSLRLNPVAREELDRIIDEESARLRDYEQRFHPRSKCELLGQRILIVDDGLATGATAEAAVISAQQAHAGWIGVVAPVASTHAVMRLQRVADEVFVLCEDPAFNAVGDYFDEFAQTTDAEVAKLLAVEGDGLK